LKYKIGCSKCQTDTTVYSGSLLDIDEFKCPICKIAIDNDLFSALKTISEYLAEKNDDDGFIIPKEFSLEFLNG